MNQGIYAGYTAKANYRNPKTQHTRDSQKTGASFADKVAQKREIASSEASHCKSGKTKPVRCEESVRRTGESVVTEYKKTHPESASHVDAQVRAGKEVKIKNGVENVSTEDMTMEEYKHFIQGLLDSIPFDSTRIYDKEIISITEKGWEQMKNDADYEAWVLGYTVENRSVRNPFFGWQGASGSFYVEKFGASIEEHLGQSVGSTGPTRSTSRLRNEKSWWEKRHERMEELLEQEVQMKLRKARAKKKLEQQKYYHDRMESQERLHNFLVEGERGKTNMPSFRATGAAAAAYEDCISLFSAGMPRTHV